MPTHSDHDDEARTLLADIRARREELAEGGFLSDRDNEDPGANLELLHKLGALKLAVPLEYGGLWDGTEHGGWGTYVRAVTEISAGDGPTGQNWFTTVMVARELLGRKSGLPASTRSELARRILDDGLRFVASNAETGVAGKVTARPVEGGVLLNGTKSFNSNSGGLGMAWVGCVLEGERPARHKVLVDLRDPKVRPHDDWDNMGQRGTRSQTITYEDVFVPDGWHQPVGAPPGTAFLGAMMLLHAALMQGIGDGALDALVRHARTMTRGSLPQFAGPAEDPLILRRVGDLSSKLAASRALLYATADAVAGERAGVADDLVVDGVRAKVAAVEAALTVTAEVHEITGARSTSNAYRFDRYWRNARTFASHDSIDAKNVYIGDYELGGSLPALTTIFRF